jgi:hypothetical protein
MTPAVAERTESRARCKAEGHDWDDQGTYSKCKGCGKVKRNGKAPVAVTRIIPETGEIIEQTVPPGHFTPAKDERLTRDFKGKLLACQRPGLIWPGDEDPPVEPGETLEVGSGVSITVYKIRATKGGDHRGYYTVDDDRPALPRRVPPMYEPPETDALGFPIDPTADAIAAATIDGSYTQDPNQAVRGVGPEVDVEYRRVLGVRRRMKEIDSESSVEKRRKQERAIRDRLREVLAGLDPQNQARLLAKIEQDIQEAVEPSAEAA